VLEEKTGAPAEIEDLQAVIDEDTGRGISREEDAVRLLPGIECRLILVPADIDLVQFPVGMGKVEGK
jgi:hypothetical protein